MSRRQYVFTSESVSMVHPDKLADQISDTVLDEMLTVDPMARVACETMVTTGMVVVAGEVTCDGYVDIAETVRRTVVVPRLLDPDYGLSKARCRRDPL